ncbi:molybdenum cofactor biosynthesis protein MoaE [Alkalihalobacillus sp. AL-G]|uniref:molybdenum cofactor biosynthesis protein MoaE n=1 Tax=Alkalihalobacillus sp. AL-G TaxID=2926399 RepID=UPI002729784F|nr:molybdenum cofactor biosynthesis protein MoaE [Alkalihalobacillus sp. AL-G]WLD94892.1 molybdenum cofactor biosynthesis protein MoaE [Alkalihalobacillus sp. AL-G]
MFMITKETIDLNDVIESVVHAHAGAINTFIGTVRELTNDKRTLYLEYDAYIPMAEKKLEQIGTEIQNQWKDARVSIIHRIGRLEISDVAVAIAVSTPHRADSYAASRFAIERIKEIVPIWKKEHWEDGQQWIGDQLEKNEYPQGKPGEEHLND